MSQLPSRSATASTLGLTLTAPPPNPLPNPESFSLSVSVTKAEIALHQRVTPVGAFVHSPVASYISGVINIRRAAAHV